MCLNLPYVMCSLASANRAIGSMAEYKARKAANPDYTVMDFRIEQYRAFF